MPPGRSAASQTNGGMVEAYSSKANRRTETSRRPLGQHWIGSAERSARTVSADALAQWTLGEISGEYGGIAGFRSVTVRISASRSPEWQS